MPNDLRVRVASLASTQSFGGTDQQFSNNILNYCKAMGISVEGTNQEVLDRFVAHLYDDVRRVAKQYTKRQKALAKEDEVDAEVDDELGSG